jgi:hypothetical protein
VLSRFLDWKRDYYSDWSKFHMQLIGENIHNPRMIAAHEFCQSMTLWMSYHPRRTKKHMIEAWKREALRIAGK